MLTAYFLTATAAHGFLWLILLFIICFLFVHILRLAQLGRKYQKECKKPPASPKSPPIEEKKSPPSNEGGCVYYIVERKRRAKQDYGEPKRIQFK